MKANESSKKKRINKKNELICKFDRLAFPVRDNIPIMLEHEARLIPLEEKDKLE